MACAVAGLAAKLVCAWRAGTIHRATASTFTDVADDVRLRPFVRASPTEPSMASKTSEADQAYAEALRRIEARREQGSQGRLLSLSGLGLTRVPPEIGELTALTMLSLYDNQLTTLPPEIGQLGAL